MPFRKSLIRITIVSISALIIQALFPPLARAKIGESINSFKAKCAKEFQFKGTDSKGNSTYYRFTLIPTKEEQDDSPGFGAGMTITVVGGQIQGQAMALRIGQYYEAGKVVVARRALKFILESIGKPSLQKEEDQLLESVKMAVDQALRYIPQSIQFPGYNHRVKVSFGSSGDIIVAVLPPSPPPQFNPNLAPPGSYLR